MVAAQEPVVAGVVAAAAAVVEVREVQPPPVDCQEYPSTTCQKVYSIVVYVVCIHTFNMSIRKTGLTKLT